MRLDLRCRTECGYPFRVRRPPKRSPPHLFLRNPDPFETRPLRLLRDDAPDLVRRRHECKKKISRREFSWKNTRTSFTLHDAQPDGVAFLPVNKGKNRHCMQRR